MNRAGVAVRLCVGAALIAACTDPRARPVPPEVSIQFAPSFRLTSPGQLLGALHLQDSDGLSSLHLYVSTADSALAGDSLLALNGESEADRPINWTVPTGLATGTLVTVIATVRDFAGFTTSDTVKIAVQDPTPGVR